MSTQKNPAAVALGKARWKNKTKAERKAHSLHMARRRRKLIRLGKKVEALAAVDKS